jgi:hypothetical protein
MNAEKPQPRSSKTFLIVSVVFVFPLLVLVFGQIFNIFLLRLLAFALPAKTLEGWPVQVAFWTLAVLAAFSVCRLLLRTRPTREPRNAPR